MGVVDDEREGRVGGGSPDRTGHRGEKPDSPQGHRADKHREEERMNSSFVKGLIVAAEGRNFIFFTFISLAMLFASITNESALSSTCVRIAESSGNVLLIRYCARCSIISSIYNITARKSGLHDSASGTMASTPLQY